MGGACEATSSVASHHGGDRTDDAVRETTSLCRRHYLPRVNTATDDEIADPRLPLDESYNVRRRGDWVLVALRTLNTQQYVDESPATVQE